jgi:dTDP-4-amino-4,6-dideoxygalactose transaminase
MQKYLKKFTKKLINTEILAKQIVTLPIYPLLKTTEQNKIFKVIRNWYKKK